MWSVSRPSRSAREEHSTWCSKAPPTAGLGEKETGRNPLPTAGLGGLELAFGAGTFALVAFGRAGRLRREVDAAEVQAALHLVGRVDDLLALLHEDVAVRLEDGVDDRAEVIVGRLAAVLLDVRLGLLAGDLASLTLDRIGDLPLAGAGPTNAEFIFGKISIDQRLSRLVVIRRDGLVLAFAGDLALDDLGAEVVGKVLGDDLVESVRLAFGQLARACGIRLRDLDRHGDGGSDVVLAADLAGRPRGVSIDMHLSCSSIVRGIARGSDLCVVPHGTRIVNSDLSKGERSC